MVLGPRCCCSGSALLLGNALVEFSAEALAFLHGLSSFCFLSSQQPHYREKNRLKAEVHEVA